MDLRHGQYLVLYPCDNWGFKRPCGVSQQGAVRRQWYSLGERCNTAAGHHRGALRVSLSTPTDCVPPLDKGAAIACEARLAVNVDKLTEFVIITWIEYRLKT